MELTPFKKEFPPKNKKLLLYNEDSKRYTLFSFGDYSISECNTYTYLTREHTHWMLQDDLPKTENEMIEIETEMFNTCCGSCSHFQSLMGEAGMCELNENNCLCKNPKAMIDMWNDKCEKWEAEPARILK